MSFDIAFCVLIALNSFVCLSNGYPNGSPNSDKTCTSFFPKHDKAQPQTSDCPFKITGQLRNGSIQVLIESTQNYTFRGFAINAKVVNGSDQPFGSFLATDPVLSHTMDCLGQTNNAITHSDRSEKQSLSVQWLPPIDTKEEVICITFGGTVVQSMHEFWVDQRSVFCYHPSEVVNEEVHNRNAIRGKDFNELKADVENSSSRQSLDYVLIASVVLLFYRRN